MFEEIHSFWNYYDSKRPINIIMTGFSYCDKTYSIARKDSGIMQFEYVYEGSGTLEINGQTVHPCKNDVCIVTKHSNHKYYSDAETPWHKIWVAFDGPLIEEIAAHQLPENLYLVQNCNIAAYMEEILNISKIYAGNYDRITDEIMIILMKIMVDLKNHINSQTKNLPETVKFLLDSHIEEHLNLNQICAELNYTKNHIIKVFKSFYGITPYTYYRNKKIEVAKRYLDNTGLSIIEIADRLCFADSQYFSGCFKELVGITPSQYRRKK